jgi:hypothetical protein
VSAGSVLTLAARAAIWRATPDPRLGGLPSLLLWIIGLAVVRVALQFAAAGPTGGFNPYGLNAVVARLALEVAVAALFVQAAARATVLSAMFALLTLAELAAGAAKLGITRPPSLITSIGSWNDRVAPIAVFAAVSVW